MYAHSHHTILTQSEVREFIGKLNAIAYSEDREKAVESTINELLDRGLKKAYPGATVVHDYRNNTDGYIEISHARLLKRPYALLIEAKRDLDLSGSARDRSIVYAQVCWYLREFSRSGQRVPSVVVVCDADEVFALPVYRLVEHYTNDAYSWDQHAASSMYKDTALLQALINDINVQRPYVHSILVSFDPDMFIWSVDAMGRKQEPMRVPVNNTSLEHVFTRFKMEVLGTDASGLKNKDEVNLFIDILRGNDDIYAHPKKDNTLVWRSKHISIDTHRFEFFWS